MTLRGGDYLENLELDKREEREYERQREMLMQDLDFEYRNGFASAGRGDAPGRLDRLIGALLVLALMGCAVVAVVLFLGAMVVSP